ncbi:alpha-hydroxy-acid oxidizing enzyme [Bordetella genomosp. 9]|uniref:Alpha-hydroxy-acid oxidizing enzyme n=1 Tax=Bordetella genomosp. 9 TaxID=1416803 RepID=A0A261R4A2_9BORD|nr:alpha-hydroxy acid oxidase [Bordetella genomosp. 9]OZI19482.1 alpha-hydroxy-acid oxidizing enzyme [Bordetella genomosp. 9]
MASQSRPRALERVFSLDDFQRQARRRLPRAVYEYVAGGTEDTHTLRENRAVFDEHLLVTRVMRDVSRRSVATNLYGEQWSAPFGICPMGLSALAAYRGDVALARAAQAFHIPMIVSGTSTIRMEDVIAANPDAWFQAYLPGDIERTTPLLERVKAAGYRTLVLTFDTFVGASRENQVRAGFTTPLRPSLSLAWDGLSHPGWLTKVFLRTLLRTGMPHFENSFATRGAPIISATAIRDHAPKDHMDWERFSLIRESWRGKLIVKGLLHPEDCRIARDRGADGIIVSNHGGRQLDGSPSSVRMLPAVIAALESSGSRIPVMVDGGFRRGTDVIKALALGADFVFVGRPFNFANVVAGEAGVLHAAKLLRDEVFRALGMVGYNAIAELAHARADGVLLAAGPSARSL